MGISNLMANPGALSISGGLYARPALTSPMAQLTCLLPSHSSENIPHIGQKVPPNVTSATKVPNSKAGLGVPGKPGSGALTRRLEQLNSRKQRRQQQGSGITRPDLGTVYAKKTPEREQTNTSTLGTLSSLLFGRKGGLF